MRKIVLLVVLSLVSFATYANEVINENSKNERETSRYGYLESIRFIERGIEFFVFTNGEFDFNTHPNGNSNNYWRRTSVNTTYGAPGSNRRYYYGNYGGIRIEHDHLGRVRRIGNVFINYDRYGRIKRAGSIYMSYHRDALRRVGGLRLYYNRFGDIIRTTGRIKYNMGCHFCGHNSCHINHYSTHPGNGHGHGHGNGNGYGHGNDDHGDYYENDDSYYYYRNKKGKSPKKGK